MTTSLLWVMLAISGQGLNEAGTGFRIGAGWPPLRAAGLLGAESRATGRASEQPPAPKKPAAVPAPSGAPAAPKADKPIGEGSFDDFGFGPEAGAKPAVPAVPTGTGKAAPSATAKPPAGAAVSKPIGPVRLTARPEPLPRLLPVTAGPAASGALGALGSRSAEPKEALRSDAKPEVTEKSKVAKDPEFVKGKKVK